MVLLAFDKLQNVEISEIVGASRHCVGRWRRRWRDSYEALLSIEMNEPRAVLERAIMDVLRDAHRSGAPCKFSPEQVVQLVSMACEDPRSCDRPVDTWSGRELADEMQKRGMVDSISASRVNELLRQIDLQPHRHKYWCFTTEKDHELFEQQVNEVCEVYLSAASDFHQQGARTICVDEMTSLGANERRAETLRSIPGQVARRECQYNRHGTLSLTGSWDVVEGQMIQTTIDETRNGEDFAQHMKRTFATDPAAHWIVVLDNLTTHCGEAVVKLIAELLGVADDTLGNKKKRTGILGSVKSRREFLTDRSHRIRFVFTPKHSSWLNQIEMVFGVISRRIMRYGNFTSKQDLKQKLLSFVDYFNRTFASHSTGHTTENQQQKTTNAQKHGAKKHKIRSLRKYFPWWHSI